MADVPQHLRAGGHRDAAVDVDRLRPMVLSAMDDESDPRFHRPAGEHPHVPGHALCVLPARLQQFCHRLLADRTVDHDAECTVPAVLHDQNDGVVEPRIANIRGGHQKLPDQRVGRRRAGVRQRGARQRHRREKQNQDQNRTRQKVHATHRIRSRLHRRDPGEVNHSRRGLRDDSRFHRRVAHDRRLLALVATSRSDRCCERPGSLSDKGGPFVSPSDQGGVAGD